MWNPNTARSEDCLYLNVWRPSCSVGCNEPKPIMVWIYGGGFYSGSTTLDVYDGSYLSAYKDVIVVSIAYRLGVLGFMFSDSDDAPGNMGLLDQTMALRWVKDNAVNLGGSPDDITLFGESAGAISVGYHLLSPLSRDLFTYAIMESASPLFELPAGKKEAALNKTIILADILSCPTDPPAAMMTCLREIDSQTITKKQWELERFYPGIPFWPLVDGYFLPDEPALMIQRGDVKNTSVIIGVNANEGTYFFVYLFMKYFPINGDGQITERQYDEILHEIFSGDSSKVSQVKQEYSREPGLSYTARLDAIYGDKRFKCPVVDFAREYAKVGGKIYLYSFEHRVSTNPWPEWLGVAHGYEIEIVFGLPLAPSSRYTDQERELSLKVMELWTNLAKTG
ncbi:acetylcholinesterase-like [Physella acuta]|uniref:acetylcholinesterase-like n=1 Tax=Physella acuta TaxID=109671 RepID=UPI0027DB0BBD|nr:acetylcholinesterase-like [Physella acuta]